MVTLEQAQATAQHVRINANQRYEDFTTEMEIYDAIYESKQKSKQRRPNQQGPHKRNKSAAASMVGAGGFVGEEYQFSPPLFNSPILWLLCFGLHIWYPYCVGLTSRQRLLIDHA